MLNDTPPILQDELSADERLLWSGQPKQGLMLRLSDVILIPFSLLWTGFAIFWESSVVMSGAPTFFALWGIPFILMGIYLIIGRFFVDAWQRAKTYYAVTNKRILIISGLFSRNVRTLNLKTLHDMSLSLKRAGRGTITFGPSHPMATWYAGSAWPGRRRYMAPALEMIEDAKTVYELIRKTQEEY